MTITDNQTGKTRTVTSSGDGAFTALQLEARKRYAHGLTLQANYTFQKVLTNAIGTAQARFDPYLDLQQPRLEYTRADYDTTQIFNFNGNYALPFGKGRRWLSQGGLTDKVLGGWQLTSIVRLATGAPLTFIDARHAQPHGAFGSANRQFGAEQIRNQGFDRRAADEVRRLFH